MALGFTAGVPGRSPAVAARSFATSPDAYFDLEDPLDLARLEAPRQALAPLTGLVVIDEIQRRPDLFPLLRVLADREGSPARFLILGEVVPAFRRAVSVDGLP